MFKFWQEHSQLLGRLRQILRVLAQHGFYQILKRLSLHRRLSLLERFRYTRRHQQEDKSSAIHLRQACEELGPTFVEFGQLLSGRSDLLPEPYIQELSQLLAHTRPESWKTIKPVLDEELVDYQSAFKAIKQQALAAGSIAQIHQATLKADSEKLVLKIQRPGIKKVIASDLVVLRLLAHMAEKYVPESRALNLVDMVEEFAVCTSRELDFVLEAANTVRFSRAFADDPFINAPRIYWEWTTPKVLVMEYIEGIPIDDVSRMRHAGVDLPQLAQSLLHAFFEQVFRFGFFHADPHAGNFLVQPDNRIILIDFGIVGQVSRSERQTLAELFRATMEEDYEKVANLWLDISHAGTEVDHIAFQRGLEPILRRQMSLPYNRIRLGDMFLQMIQNGARHGLMLPGELFLLFRTFAEFETLLHLIHPDFNVIGYCREYIQEQEAAQRDPARMVQTTGDELEKLAGTAWRLPGEVEEVINKMASDKFSVDFVHKGLEFLIGELDRSSNRIVMGLIIAALIIGSSLIILAGAGPKLWGLPVFGLTGFTVAFVFGVFLVLLVLRSGKY